MDKVLGGPYGGSYGLVIEPKRGRKCAQCGIKLDRGSGDAFCSTECCKAHYGVNVDRPDPRLRSTREHEIWCPCCKRYLPDEAFAVHAQQTHRRGRRERCRECSALIRKGRKRGPGGVCQGCGKPCDSEALVCRPCWRLGVKGVLR